jgi:hypothetical protein
MEPQKNDGVVNLVPPNVTANSVPPPYARPSAQIISDVPQSVPPVVPPTYNSVPPKKSHKGLIFAILLIILLLLGSVAYLFMAKVGPFSLKSYPEETFFSEVAKNIVEIKSSSYSLSGSLNVVPRDSDAEPFTVKVSNEAELKKKYFYDYQRAGDVGSILTNLKYYTGSSYYNTATQKLYPASLKTALAGDSYYSSSKSTTDPETNNEYSYRATNGGKNFELTVNFSTDDAIKAIKRYGYVSTTTIISGKKVTFTKDSYQYFYVSQEPPKPFLVSLSDSLRQLPADVNVKVTFGGATDFTYEDMADWKFNFDATGDFGDLTYKVNAEALKKDKDYYFKINNIPSLFGDLSNIKGKWIKIPGDEATTTANDPYSYSSLSYLKTSIAQTEKSYKEDRANASKFLKKLISIADEEKLVTYIDKPKTEKVDNRNLVKYTLTLNKDSVLPFYKSVYEEINSDPDFKDFKYFVDQGLIDYLESDEFSQVFDYVNKNNKFVLWTDEAGYPAIIENTMRVVPPDTATQLEGKQINLTFKVTIDDVNKKIEINVPKDATLIDSLISSYSKNLEGAQMKGKDAAVKSNINSIRASAELYYDSNNSYGKTFSLGSCKKTAGTLFSDSYVSKALDAATENNISSATCVANPTGYAVSVPLPSDKTYSWCVDSQGNAKQIMGALKGDVCK